MGFLKTIQTLMITMSFLLVGCQAYNTSSSDQIKFGGDDSAFSKAQTVFASKCSGCHDYHTYDEATFVTKELVVPADSFASLLYQSLKGSNVGGDADMPQNSGLLAKDREAIRTWIDGMTP